jgi:hypothetical protein
LQTHPGPRAVAEVGPSEGAIVLPAAGPVAEPCGSELIEDDEAEPIVPDVLVAPEGEEILVGLPLEVDAGGAVGPPGGSN